MDLVTTYTEVDNGADNSKSAIDSAEGMSFVEEHIRINEFDLHTENGEEEYVLGLINFSGNKVGFIVNTYFNKKLAPEEDISIEETVIFDSQKVKFKEDGFKPQTVKNVYLVKYVLGELVINEKTGKEQRTINYDYPVVIVRVFSRRSTAYLAINQDELICKYHNGVPTKVSELDEQTRISVQVELAKKMGGENIIFASSFPQVLKNVGIEDYKKYADSIEQFVNVYLNPEFCFVKNIKMEGKVYPGVIIRLNGRDVSEVLQEMTLDSAKLSKKDSNNTQSVMAEEVRKQVVETMEKAAEKNGFVYGSALPGILESIDVDYKQYALGIAEFCEKYISDSFEYKNQVTINGKKHFGVLFLKTSQSEVDHEEETLLYESELFDEYREMVDVHFGLINICTSKTGFINQEYVDKKVYPDYCLDGSKSTIFETKKVNFEPDSTNIKTIKYVYLVAYFMDGVVLNSKTGIEQPALDYNRQVKVIKVFSKNEYVRIKIGETGIITEKASSAIVFEESDQPKTNNRQADYRQLLELFQTGFYYEFLSSDAFKSIKFCEMPEDIRVAAVNCAAKLLGVNHDIEFNRFQKELITNLTSSDFIKKWKSRTGFDQEIIEECGATSIFSFSMASHKGYIFECLNNIGYSNARNDNYPGLTKRFGLCHNQMLPYLFLIRAIAQENRPAVERCISEYIQIVKSLQQMDSYSKINEESKMYLIKEFLIAIDKYVYPLNELPRLLITSIASVFVDVGQMTEYKEMIELINLEPESVDQQLIDLYFNFEECTEQQIKNMLNQNVSIQLLQKVISLVWERYSDAEEMPKNMIRVLAWISLNDSPASVDEIVRYHLVNKKFHKLKKTAQMLNSFTQICSMVEEDISMHVMASYIRFVVCEESLADKFDEICSEIINSWQMYTSRLIDKVTSEYGEVNSENNADYLKLFRVFRLDMPNQIRFQNVYSSWYLKNIKEYESSPENLENILEWLFENRAYKTFSVLFIEYRNIIREDNSKYLRQYISSLMELQRYGEAIEYLQQNSSIEQSLKNELLIRVLGENFRGNGLSTEAFAVFYEEFTRDDAFELLIKEFRPNQYPIVTCLISLYCEKRDYMRAAYLYIIFQSRAEKGYTRLYGQIRSILKSFVGKLKNHYDVIEFAFTTLRHDELIDFFKWTQLIFIPALKDYNPTHTFAFFYEKLMNSPTDENNWIDFFAHLVKRIDVNAWAIVVCESILQREFDNKEGIYSANAIRTVLNTVKEDQIPYNLLPYTFNYIITNKDISMCEDLYRVLGNNEIYDKLFDKNLWAENYKPILDAFKVFCLRQFGETGKEVYYKLVVLLGTVLDINELSVLAQTAGDKSYLYRVICSRFIESADAPGIVELLTNSEWNNMTARDLAMLDLLRLLYRDEEFYLRDKLFVDETEVCRFKSDCAKILSVYPDKRELFEFDKNCLNDRYKLQVYTYVFTALYDEDIYHKYEYSYEELLNNEDLFYAYIRFVTTVFYAQLEWNREYPYFYKKWRYLKLYLAASMFSDGVIDENRILEAMEQNGHYESVYEEGYKLFVETTKKFLGIAGITQNEKREILYSLMMGRMRDFLQTKGEKLRYYSAEEKRLLKEMILQLDYREVSLSFYRKYWPIVQTGDFTEAENVASALSNYISDTLAALRNWVDDKKLCEIFDEILLLDKPSEVVESILQIEEAVYLKYKEVLMPLLCSRQFLFWTYGTIRTRIVQRKANLGMKKYIVMLDYISNYKPDEAKAVKGYLLALNACVYGKREEALSILQNTDITSEIPTQWKKEAISIKNYAEGKLKSFKSDATILDSSLENERKPIRLWFLDKLQSVLRIEKRRIDFKTASTLFEQYLDKNTDFQERIKSIVDLITNYPKLDKDQKKELQLPEKNDLILSMSLEVLEEGNFFNTTDRLAILFDLYFDRKMFRNNIDGIKRLSDIVGLTLKTNTSLEMWVKYRAVIKEFLDDNHMIMDFSTLQERILERCAVLAQEDISRERKYAEYNKLLAMTEGLESIYSRNVFDAIRGVCRRIEDSPRLEIEIVNDKLKMTDENVYFVIRNIGKSTVTLSEECIVIFKQDGHPEVEITIDSINDLQSTFITGGKARPVIGAMEQYVVVSLAVYKKSRSNKLELLCDTSKTLNICEAIDELKITRRNRYKVGSDSAVTDADMLFGRSDIQNSLQDMIPAGLTVMYGPSRIGKTSIMNWIRNKLAVSKGNVISIIFGGEGGMGKESDYQESFVDSNGHSPVPYEDDKKMTEYLLISTIVHSMTNMKRRLKVPSVKKLSDDLFIQVVDILKDSKLSIEDRYDYVNKILVKEDVELWLLLDEFQQVVERWKPKASCEFVRVCKMLLYDGKNSNIKLILCGSDDLLRHMVLEDESVWRQTFPDYTRIPVEPLKKTPFCDMIKKDRRIADTNLIYSQSALDALFSYTGGVALYGKEIGNVLLDDVESNPEKYTNRNIVYASDIADATQRLLNRQASELDTKAKEGIREIYDAVTKNLKPDTDMQYLWYIAKWLKSNPNYDSFDESIFTNNEKLRDVKELHDSLEIAVARGILVCKESQINGVNSYVFRTIFYYFAFLGSLKNNLDESKIFTLETAPEIETEIKENALTLIAKFDELSETDRMTVFSSVYFQKLSENANKLFRKGIGNQYGDVVQGSKIGTQNNIQINIQNMTNALTNIMLGQNLLESYQQLPKLSTYVRTQLSEQDYSLLESKYQSLQNSGMTDEERQIIQDDIYEVSAPAIDAMASDYIAAEMNAIMNGEYSDADDLEDTELEQIIWGVSKETIDGIRQSLPAGIQIQFDFALMLHKIFYKLKDETDVDYCPVAILYCKMVEGLLKDKHFEVYIQKLSGGGFEKVRIGNKDYDWSFFLSARGTIDKEKVKRNRKKLSIGTFSFPLGKISNEKDANSAVLVDNDVIDALATPVGKDIPNQKELRVWRRHAELLPWIRVYRNKSAHELSPISRADMDHICSILFENDELNRIMALIPKTRQN